MSDLPEDRPREPIISSAEGPLTGAATELSPFAAEPSTALTPFEGLPPSPGETPPAYPSYAPPPVEPPTFLYPVQPPVRPPARIPNFGHLALLLVLLVLGLLVTGVLWAVAVHDHLYGATSLQGSMTDIHYLLGSEVVLYFTTFLVSLLIFPLFWHKNLFAGLQWNGATALRLRWRLAGAAFACFLLALLNEVLIPGPTNAPIEKIFRTPGAAWLLFGFGVTIAPFFEEIFFRGFLLPSFCTAFDWFAEAVSAHEETPEPLAGKPRWPFASQLISGAVMAIPIAATCAFPRAGHYRIRLLVIGFWAVAFTVGWAIGRSESQAKLPRFARVDANGYPNWSVAAMAFSSLLVR
jgi:uncharacterized protein